MWVILFWHVRNLCFLYNSLSKFLFFMQFTDKFSVFHAIHGWIFHFLMPFTNRITSFYAIHCQNYCFFLCNSRTELLLFMQITDRITVSRAIHRQNYFFFFLCESLSELSLFMWFTVRITVFYAIMVRFHRFCMQLTYNFPVFFFFTRFMDKIPVFYVIHRRNYCFFLRFMVKITVFYVIHG